MIHPAAAKVMEGDGSVRSKYGFSVKKASDGKCEIEMNVLSDWINAAGYTHGSVAYAIMDSACAYASASLNKLAVTINGNINYTKGDQGRGPSFGRCGTPNTKCQAYDLRGESD